MEMHRPRRRLDLMGDIGSLIGLTPPEKLVLFALAWLGDYRPEVTVSQSTIAQWTGYSRDTVNRTLSRLAHERKLIRIITNTDPDGARLANTYEFIDESDAAQ